MRKLPLVGLLVLALCSGANATTYYVDYDNGKDLNSGATPVAAYKHCPGDANFSGVYLRDGANGDMFVFKGGVNYRGRIDLKYSGVSNLKRIVYDGNSTGNFGVGRAIINGDNINAESRRYGFYGTTDQSYITIQNFEFVDFGGASSYAGYDCTTAPPSSSGFGIYLTGTFSYVSIIDCLFHELSYWENTAPVAFSIMEGCGISVTGSIQYLIIDSCEFTKTAKGIRISPAGGKAARDVEIKNCDLHNYFRWLIELSTSGNNTALENIDIHDNRLHDFTEYDSANFVGCGAAAHTDGIIMGVSNYSNRTYGTVRIYNNEFSNDAITGGGTAMIFFTGMGGNVQIYNNTFQNVLHGDGAIYVQDGVTLSSGDTEVDFQIYNNTFFDTRYAIFLRSPLGDLNRIDRGRIAIENNIFYKPNTDATMMVLVYDAYSMPDTLDNNLYYTGRTDKYVAMLYDIATAKLTPFTLTGLQAKGFETNGGYGDPAFWDITYGLGVNTSLNNLQVKASNVKIGKNLSAFFSTDKKGRMRSATDVWSVGAFEDGPLPPKGLKASY